jgi:uncharacterized membrane protein HdeD (DUF308 family)
LKWLGHYGVVDVFSAIGAAGSHRPWGWQLAGGLVRILAGLAILRWPGLSALCVLYLVAIWAIMMGIVRVVGAIADHEALPHAWLVALAGIVSVLFGIAMFAWPGVGLLTLVDLVGIYAIVYGLITCGIAFRLHSLPARMAGTLMMADQAVLYGTYDRQDGANAHPNQNSAVGLWAALDGKRGPQRHSPQRHGTEDSNHTDQGHAARAAGPHKPPPHSKVRPM